MALPHCCPNTGWPSWWIIPHADRVTPTDSTENARITEIDQNIVLTGKRVHLRRLGSADADAHHRWNHDPEVMRWFAASDPVPLEAFRDGYEERRRITVDDACFGIVVAETGRLIGLVRLSGVHHDTRMAEVDIYIGEKDEWGKGYGADAMRLACRFGFEHMGLHRIHLEVVAANASAVRSYGKVGFVEEGRTRETFLGRDGEWYDHYIMGILDRELRD